MHGDCFAAREVSFACTKTCIYCCFLNCFVQLSFPCGSDFPLYQCDRASWHILWQLQLCGLKQTRLWLCLSQLSLSVLWAGCLLFWVNWWFIRMCSTMWEESQRSNMKMKGFFPKNLLQGFTLIFFWKSLISFFKSQTESQMGLFLFLILFSQIKVKCNFR